MSKRQRVEWASRIALACDVTPLKSFVRVNHGLRGRWHRQTENG
jgi:hypothetical protein